MSPSTPRTYRTAGTLAIVGMTGLLACGESGGDLADAAPEAPDAEIASPLQVVDPRAFLLSAEDFEGWPTVGKGGFVVLFAVVDEDGDYITDPTRVSRISIRGPDAVDVSIPPTSTMTMRTDGVMDGYLEVDASPPRTVWVRLDFNQNRESPPTSGDHVITVTDSSGGTTSGVATFTAAADGDPMGGFPRHLRYDSVSRALTWEGPEQGHAGHEVYVFGNRSLNWSQVVYSLNQRTPDAVCPIPQDVEFENGVTYYVTVDAYDNSTPATANYVRRSTGQPITPVTDLAEVIEFGDNPGNLRMFEYVPKGLPAGAPLVVALHGNNSTANNLTNAGWNALADQYNLAILYPEQRRGNTRGDRVGVGFRYWQLEHQARGQGEPASIMRMVEHMHDTHGIDLDRVFVTGISGGAAMASILMAAYPDRIESGALFAGLPYQCATNADELLGDSVLEDPGCADLDPPINAPTSDREASVWGDLVRTAFPEFTDSYPRVSIWHGQSDAPVNADMLVQQMKQWTNAHAIDQTADVTTTELDNVEYRGYQNAAGETLVETYLVTDPMSDSGGHAIPVDADSPHIAGGCGTHTQYYEDIGICSAYHVARFWGIAD